MLIFLSLVLKILPFYALMLLGFLATRFLNVQRESISRLLIYVILPVIVFFGAYQAPISWSIFMLPVIFYLLSSIISFVFYSIGKKIWISDSTKNLLAHASATGNTGYFGLPLVFLLLSEQAFSYAVLVIMGISLFENSLGFFYVAKGSHSTRDSLLRVAKLPVLYAFVLGFLFNTLGIKLPSILFTTLSHFKGAYTVLGMMLLGMGLVYVGFHHIDWKYMGLAFTAKFLVWPLVIGLLIFTDANFFNFYNPDIYKVMLIMSIVPLAINNVAFAIELKVHPEKSAITVLLSTILALFLIPLFAVAFIF
ncbi:AEC family transporter [Candidatus Margulisiibacteriota bacterium]